MSKINEEKYKNIILYLSSKLGGEIRGKKKLAKLLYFADFDFFEKENTSITGEIYKALPMGPFPVHMENIIKELEKEKKLTVSAEDGVAGYLPTEVYRTKAEAKRGIFSKEEIKILDRVVIKYGNLNGKQLEDLTHGEAPYIGTEPNKEIVYELAYYRGTDFTENA